MFSEEFWRPSDSGATQSSFFGGILAPKLSRRTNRIVFEGNKRIEDNILAQELQLKPRIVYTQSKVQDDLKRLINVYRSSGYFGISIDPKVIKLDQNRIDLVFEIDEGEVTRIKRIIFQGNINA